MRTREEQTRKEQYGSCRSILTCSFDRLHELSRPLHLHMNICELTLPGFGPEPLSRHTTIHIRLTACSQVEWSPSVYPKAPSLYCFLKQTFELLASCEPTVSAQTPVWTATCCRLAEYLANMGPSGAIVCRCALSKPYLDTSASQDYQPFKCCSWRLMWSRGARRQEVGYFETQQPG